MPDKAHVLSVEQLEQFQADLLRFRTKLLSELENLQVEIRRISNWLQNDVQSYWSDEAIKAGRKLVECRDALTRCMSYVRESERRPCTEEKKRLRNAELRKELCENKLRITAAAITFWEAELVKLHTRVQRCQDLAESNMLVAGQHLASQIENLRTYAGLRSNAFTSSSPGEPSAKSSPATPPSANDAADTSLEGERE